MKKVVTAIFLAFYCLLPIPVFAECSAAGSTVVVVNGILTSYDEALQNLKALETEFSKRSNLKNITFLTGYNPSHLAGADDWIKSIEQAYQGQNSFIDDYDLDSILLQIYPQVATRKILLVGHSQGTFYTNALYQYLITHGVPKESIAVYNIATPASYVAGGGSYLTSSNDALINSIRGLASQFGARRPLPANIAIPLPQDEPEGLEQGHDFTQDYLSGAPDRIVSDMQHELQGLAASESSNTGDCFTPPDQTLGYKTERATFAVSDPLASAADTGVRLATAAVQKTYALAKTSMGAALALTAQIVPIPNSVSDKQTTVTALQVTKALYGSSLSEEDASDLLGASRPSPTPIKKAIPIPPSPQKPAPIPPAQPSAPAQPSVPIPAPHISISPGYGGGAPSSAPTVAVLLQPLALTVISPTANFFSATSSVTFVGTTTPNEMVDIAYSGIEATTSADSSGNWSYQTVLPEGTASFAFSVFNDATQATDTINRTVTVDTIPPAAPALSVPTCAHSLAIDPSVCLVSDTHVGLSWPAISDAAYYAVAGNGTWLATTTATNAIGVVPDEATTTLEIVAIDAAGNAATSSAQNVTVFTRPVVINEIGWGGTYTSAADQWLELYDRTPYNIDLSNAAIYSPDGATYIPLTGVSVLPQDPSSFGFAVLENTAGSPHGGHISPNGYVTPIALPSSGAELVLAYFDGSATTTLDRTPGVAICGGWCAGTLISTAGYGNGASNSTGPISMERIAAATDGSLVSNWADNDGYSPLMSQDSGGVVVIGTPGMQNSLHQPDIGFFCGTDTLSIHAGDTYAPQGPGCTFLSRAIPDGQLRYGGLYRGTVGSSTLIGANSLGAHNTGFLSVTTPPDVQAGEQFFAVMWPEDFVFNTASDFDEYFRTGTTTSGLVITSADYRTIPFTLGP